MSVTGVCFDFRVALVGPPRSGKSRFARYWTTCSDMTSQERKRTLEAARANPPPTYVPTVFTEMHHLDVDIRECVDASVHRVHVVDTPGQPSNHCLFRSVLGQKSVAAVDLCVFFATGDSGTTDDDEEVCTEDMLAEVADLCEASVAEHGRPVALLVIDMTPPSNGPLNVRGVRGGATITNASVLVVEEYDDVLIANAVIKMLCEAHRRKCDERDLAIERLAVTAETRSLRDIKRGELLPAKPLDARFEIGHVDNPDYTVSIATLGMPGVGRSTFLAAALDGFVLREYVPTRKPDVGTFRVSYGGIVANVTLHDGPVQGLIKNAQAVITFVDPSSFTADADAQNFAEFVEGVNCVNVILFTDTRSVKGRGGTSAVELMSADDMSRAAGRINGFWLSSVDCRDDNSDVLASVVCQVIHAQEALRAVFQREMELMAQRCLPTPAFHGVGCSTMMKALSNR